MSREIKFRAWDGEKIRFDVTGFEHGKANEMAGIFLDGDYYDISDSAYPLHPQAVVMQFTGLTDKNGVEIYEKDYLEGEDGAIWVVSFDERGSFVAHDPEEDQNFVFCDDFRFEVIGNIYMTPELLEATS